jgi:hypothetical protein
MEQNCAVKGYHSRCKDAESPIIMPIIIRLETGVVIIHVT